MSVDKIDSDDIDKTENLDNPDEPEETETDTNSDEPEEYVQDVTGDIDEDEYDDDDDEEGNDNYGEDNDDEKEEEYDSSEDISGEDRVPTLVIDHWLRQAKKCCQDEAWDAAENAVNELFSIVEDNDRTAEMLCIAAVVSCKHEQFREATDYAKQAFELDPSPKVNNIRALITLDRYKVVSDEDAKKPNPDAVKFLQRTIKATSAALSKAQKEKSRSDMANSFGLIAEARMLLGEKKKAKQFALDGEELSDSWGKSEYVLEELDDRKDHSHRNILTAVGFVLFLVLAAVGLLFVYTGFIIETEYPTFGLVGFCLSISELIVSTFAMTFIWASNATTRRHGSAPIAIATILNFLIWGAVIAYIIYSFLI